MELLYEGKAKKMYRTDNPDELLMEFKDDATAFNGVKKEQFENKGRMNKRLTDLFYDQIEAAGIATHRIRDIDDIRQIVKRVEIVPLEMVVRNTVAGSLAKRTGLDEGTAIPAPFVETFYKKDELNDPIITDDHIQLLGLCTPDELAELKRLSLAVNAVLLPFFAKVGIRLIDFKMEFGRAPDGAFVLADEISPDTCRLWDAETDEKMDKDRFRRDLGGVMEGYAEVLNRVEAHLAN